MNIQLNGHAMLMTQFTFWLSLLFYLILMTNNIIFYFILFSNNFKMSLTKACRNSRICWVQTEIDCHYCKVQALQCNLMYCKDISTQWTSKWKLWKWKSDVIVRYWTDQLSAHHWIIDSSTFWHSKVFSFFIFLS